MKTKVLLQRDAIVGHAEAIRTQGRKPSKAHTHKKRQPTNAGQPHSTRRKEATPQLVNISCVLFPIQSCLFHAVALKLRPVASIIHVWIHPLSTISHVYSASMSVMRSTLPMQAAAPLCAHGHTPPIRHHYVSVAMLAHNRLHYAMA